MSIRAKLSEYYGFPISRAYLANVRGSAFKARLVANLIRSKDVTQALDILSLCPKRSAKIFEKLLRSAIANAINNHGMSAEGLYLFKIVVNEAKTLKRFRPILRKQVAPIRKRSCHFEILLANRHESPKQETKLEETPKEEIEEQLKTEDQKEVIETTETVVEKTIDQTKQATKSKDSNKTTMTTKTNSKIPKNKKNTQEGEQ